jgi:hypothetical protein
METRKFTRELTLGSVKLAKDRGIAPAQAADSGLVRRRRVKVLAEDEHRSISFPAIVR